MNLYERLSGFNHRLALKLLGLNAEKLILKGARGK